MADPDIDGPGSPPRASLVEDLTRALEHQRRSCESLGSPLYARIIDALLDDHLRRGTTTDLLTRAGPRPIQDAAVLRLLAGLHRRVLLGESPDLAGHYPSTGGRPGPTLEHDVLSALVEHRDRLTADMMMPVQTNEPGRSVAAMAVLLHPLLSPASAVTWREIGASAGLNLNFSRFAYETAEGLLGDPDSPLRFSRRWSETPEPAGMAVPPVLDARGCDPSPLDITTDAAHIHLASYVWPDDADRRARLEAALTVAREHPPVVDRATAAEWIGDQRPAPGTDLIFFHSIVWQYLDEADRDAIRRHVETEGRRTGRDAIGWARMEPAGDRADVRLDLWRAGRCRRVVLGTIGYHGQDFIPAARPSESD